ncbi:MAG TPA: ATP-binding protein [Thermoleophilaceae bacterium]
MTSSAHDSAVERLRVGVAEQDRLRDRYNGAIGTSTEFGAYMQLRAAGDHVAAREAWVHWVDDESYRGIGAGPFEMLAESSQLSPPAESILRRVGVYRSGGDVRTGRVVSSALLPPQLSLDVPRDRTGFEMARAVIQRYLRGDVAEDELSDVCLIMSELVTNAMVHGEGAIKLRLTVQDDLVRGEVIDDGPGFEREIPERGPDDTGGRGLLLVASLAHRWGVHEGSSQVWFERHRTRPNKVA